MRRGNVSEEKTGEKVDSRKRSRPREKKHREGGFAETELEEMCLFSWPERFNQLHVSAVNHKACHLSVGARGKLENKLWFHCSHGCHYKAGTKKSPVQHMFLQYLVPPVFFSGIYGKLSVSSFQSLGKKLHL